MCAGQGATGGVHSHWDEERRVWRRGECEGGEREIDGIDGTLESAAGMGGWGEGRGSGIGGGGGWRHERIA